MSSHDEPIKSLRRTKLTRVPDTHKIRKRPAGRPAIASPYANASSPKVVYISARTPFMSAMRRTRDLLAMADKRSLGRIKLDHRFSGQQLLRVLNEEAKRKEQSLSEAVAIKGTGKAIPKVLELALYFQGQPDCQIQLKTGTLDIIDDIEEREDALIDNDETQDQDLIPDHQVRQLSVLEVLVKLTS